MSNPSTIVLHALGAQTVSTSGTAVDITVLRTVLDLSIRVDAISGTLPTMTLIIETSGIVSGPWREVGRTEQEFNDGPDNGVFSLIVGGCAQFVRVRSIIGGSTPSFTYSVTGEAHVVYATKDDLSRYGMSNNVLDSVDNQLLLSNVLSASSEVDDYLKAAYTLPLSAFSKSLTKHTAVFAVYSIANGPNREGADEMLRDMFTDTIKWLDRIGSGRIRPEGIVDDTPLVEEDSAFVVSRVPRGW